MNSIFFLYLIVFVQMVFAVTLLLIIRTVKKTNMEAVKSAVQYERFLGVFTQTKFGPFLNIYKEYVLVKGVSFLLIIHLLSLIVLIFSALGFLIYDKTLTCPT